MSDSRTRFDLECMRTRTKSSFSARVREGIWFANSARRAVFLQRWCSALSLAYVFVAGVPAFALQITTLDRNGSLSWSNATVPGICTVEIATAAGGGWASGINAYSTAATGQVTLALSDSNGFFRIRAVDVSPTPQGFTNFVQSYGRLETVAGDGFGRTDGVSYWQPQFEGGPARLASLSRPHYAMADRAGNIYIADKDSHSVLRVATNGTIHTHAGTHGGGFNGDGPAAATSLQLNFPNALWVRSDGTVYVLDTYNGRVRRVATNGIMTTLVDATGGTAIAGGRCLWVRDDEGLLYYGNKDRIKKWTPASGLVTLASGFSELGTFCVEASGDLVVADRQANLVYRVTGSSGARTVIAGNGMTSAGGDGLPALQTSLYGPRGLWPVPTGGLLLLLHDGAQLWYLDAAATMHLLVNGIGGNTTTHSGDGQYFYDTGQYKISEGRSVAIDYAGNIIVCESDYGYIRRINFQRMTP